MLDLDELTPENPLLLHGDCIELLKTLPDKSVDLFLCDLPYGETNCSWDSTIDLGEFWKEFKRVRKSKRTACIHFCSTKFGYTLIKSWEKGFKMDMVWKKRNKTGGLQSRFRPMRNHEMVYFFYEQAPQYNRDKYHKRVRTIEPDEEAVVGDNQFWGTGAFAGNVCKKLDPSKMGSLYEPKQPTSVLEKPEYWADQPSVTKTGHGWDKTHMNTPRVPSFEPTLPPSVLETDGVYAKAFGGAGFGYDGEPHGFDPQLPTSMFESGKCFVGKRNHQTEKPQDILEFFLKYWTDEGDVVLDPTMGSGSTGVASKKMGRKFIGMELTDKYFAVAQKRIGEQVAITL